MQSVATQRTAVVGQTVRTARQQTRTCRSVVVVRAAADESRRAVLGGLVAGLTGLVVSRANALNPIELTDYRSAKDTGFELIYEARDEELPISKRDGLAQARGDIAGTKKRVEESERRIDTTIEPFINKAYWTAAREELRLQVGTLRFDLNTLAEAKGGKAEKKKALELKKNFLKEAESLDFALRSKDGAKASQYLASTKATLDAVKAYVS